MYLLRRRLVLNVYGRIFYLFDQIFTLFSYENRKTSHNFFFPAFATVEVSNFTSGGVQYREDERLAWGTEKPRN